MIVWTIILLAVIRIVTDLICDNEDDLRFYNFMIEAVELILFAIFWA